MITRREFLIKSGTVITAAAFASVVGGQVIVLADVSDVH